MMTSLNSTNSQINSEQVTKPVIKQFHDLIIGMRDGRYLTEGEGPGLKGYEYEDIVDDQEDAHSMLWKMLQKVRMKFMQSREDEAIDLAVELSARYASCMVKYAEAFDKESKAAFEAMTGIAQQEKASGRGGDVSATAKAEWEERVRGAFEAMPSRFKAVLSEEAKKQMIRDARNGVRFEGVHVEHLKQRP